MRQKYLIANWKMNLGLNESKELAQNIIAKYSKKTGINVVIAPQLPTLTSLSQELKNSQISLAAQNSAIKSEGAYTGETSPALLKEIGCDYCIIGHSERRNIFKETVEEVAEKFFLLQENQITPILCVGENLQQRKNNQLSQVLKTQISPILKHSNKVKNFILAYEPVWAIGTGLSANLDQIAESFREIMQILTEYLTQEKANQIITLYGGSVKSINAEEILSIPQVDGLLIGGASLKLGEFLDIIQISEKLFS